MTTALSVALRVVLANGAKAPAVASKVVYERLRTEARRCLRLREWEREELVHTVFARFCVGGRVFEGASDGQAVKYLRKALRFAWIDAHKSNVRFRFVDAVALDEGFPANDGAGDALTAYEVSSALSHLADYASERAGIEDLFAELDGVGLLPWTHNGALSDRDLASTVGCAKAALHKRRERVRNAVLVLLASSGLDRAECASVGSLLAA